MSVLTLNELSVVEGTIRLPRIGVWHADLRLDNTQLPSGSVKLESEDKALSLQGTVLRGEVWHERVEVRIVGGAGRFHKSLPAKFYEQVPLRLVLEDICREVGERLSTASDTSLLQIPLTRWTRFEGPAFATLHTLMGVCQGSWRLLPSGELWLGKESWPEWKEPVDILMYDSAKGFVEIASPLLSLTPGVSVQGKRISHVTHRIQAGKVRTEAWCE